MVATNVYPEYKGWERTRFNSLSNMWFGFPMVLRMYTLCSDSTRKVNSVNHRLAYFFFSRKGQIIKRKHRKSLHKWTCPCSGETLFTKLGGVSIGL